ncbi:uncharacterized protein [Drosophila bipectinata]|uniref:uncharacterized protein n=1 Tax=Drosophila bipectinata TaxID=42026 RepID=UPI001C8A45FC|nr:uncharacterized protein LOC108125527 [Drosophila bipectinata]
MEVAQFVRELVVATVFWLLFIESMIFYRSTLFNEIHELIFKPYKEELKDYNIGVRSQHWDDDTVARQLEDNVRVHCLVYLKPSDQKLGFLKVKHIQNSWARRCNHLSIVSLWETTLPAAFRQVHKDFRESFDWLLVVYLDSYVILENLRFMLAHYSSKKAIYFSAQHSFYIYAHVGQVDTTDYIFSREALEQLVTRNCLKDDVYMEECLRRVEKGPSLGLQPFTVSGNVVPFTLRKEFWLWPCIYRFVYENQSREECYAQSVVYPFVSGKQMNILEFFLYHLRAYGHVNGLQELKSEHFPLRIAARPHNNKVASHLYGSVRILCLVLTWSKNYMKGMKAISETWGRHCNRVIYYSNSSRINMAGVETVALNISDSYDTLWGKTRAAFHHAYMHYHSEFDWFYKADDDTYAIIENMRYFLKPYSPEAKIYFGSTFGKEDSIYMSGGAGYVLSRKAVRIFVKYGIKRKICYSDVHGTEDYEMGKCLSMLNVTAGDSRDIYGRHRFFSLSLGHFIIPGYDDQSFWLKNYLHHEFSSGMECCSTYSISMHYISHHEMYFLETILYKSRPYGIVNGHPPSRTSRLATIKL